VSNTPKTTPPLGYHPPQGDFGLGLCYQCVKVLAEMAAGGREPAAFVPEFAITTAPYPIAELGTVLALPVGWGCLTGQGPAGAPAPVSRLAVPR
jgi:hypothetical protein